MKKSENYEVKKEFDLSQVLELAETWYDCGNGFAAVVGKEASRQFGRGSRFAGRDCIMISKDGQKLVLGDWQGLDRFQALSREEVAGFLGQGQEEKPAAEKEAEKPAKKTSQASEKKPVKIAEKPAKETGFTVVTLDHKKLHIKPAEKKLAKKAVKTTKKAATKKASQSTKKLASQPAAETKGLQFGPGLVSDKEGKITIASLLHAGKAYASRCLPAEFSARFKKYSDDNQLLLYLQGGPALGQVATYRGWLKQGRQVTKGQHGLKILAPKMVIKEDGTKAIDGLRLVTLFSVDQTELASQEA
jgi:hypothetical protein